MTKPVVIVSPCWRRMDELFSDEALKRLNDSFVIVWGQDEKIPQQIYQQALGDAFAIVAAKPSISWADLETASRLKAVIEVSGSFPDTIDYGACNDRGVEVLSCSPGFRQSVAEMGLAMLLAGARGLVQEHEAFRSGQERWLDDNMKTDFSVYGAAIGFVGFGQIAQEMASLLQPFKPRLKAFDPWLPEAVARDHGVELVSLETLASHSHAVIVVATPTTQNKHLIDKHILAMMADQTLLVLLSRAHLVDFEALMVELEKGRLRLATDVFPIEPLPADSLLRQMPNLILSPHRAAAVKGGRHLIGDMIVDDLCAIAEGNPRRHLKRFDAARIALVAGIGDAKKTGMLDR